MKKKPVKTPKPVKVGNFKFVFTKADDIEFIPTKDCGYLKWKQLPKEVQDFYLFILKGNLDIGEFEINPDTGVGMMNTYLKEIMTHQDMLDYNKQEFVGMLLFKG